MRSIGPAFRLTTLDMLQVLLKLERERRFELPTLALARRCSTTELFPLVVSKSSFDEMIYDHRSGVP